MSQYVQDLVDALEIIRGLRKQISPSSNFQWSKLYDADFYLEKQLKAYFAEVAA